MKKRLIISFVTLLILIVGFFVVRYVVSNKITAFLDEQVEKGTLTYQGFEFDLFSGSASIGPFSYTRASGEISAEKLEVSNVSYSAYLFNKKIKVGTVRLEQPVTTLKEKPKKKKATQNKQKKSFDKKIEVDRITIEQGSFVLANDSLKKVKVDDYELSVKDFELDKVSLQDKIPFRYGDYNIAVSGLTYELNKLERLKLDSLRLDEHQLSVVNFELEPKYTRKDYIEVIPYEKDLITLSIKNIKASNYDFHFEEDQPQFTAKKIILSEADSDIYRDKTVRDDPRKKELYSGMLRKLTLKIGIDSLLIQNSKINYAERIHAERPPGEIYFEKLNARISNVTNMGLERSDFPKTKSTISCLFMGTSKMDVDWVFQVNKPNDVFSMKGRVAQIPQSSMNSFFKPALNMKANGSIEKLYFNIHGNATEANADMRLTYDNFKIEVLRKNGKDKNKVLSFLANIFVSNHPTSGSKSASVSGVQRDHTKSFWNYFWLCIQAGLKKSLSAL